MILIRAGFTLLSKKGRVLKIQHFAGFISYPTSLMLISRIFNTRLVYPEKTTPRGIENNCHKPVILIQIWIINKGMYNKLIITEYLI